MIIHIHNKIQIDIEEAEYSEGGFDDWMKSGALTQVSQIAIELHMIDNGSNLR